MRSGLSDVSHSAVRRWISPRRERGIWLYATSRMRACWKRNSGSCSTDERLARVRNCLASSPVRRSRTQRLSRPVMAASAPGHMALPITAPACSRPLSSADSESSREAMVPRSESGTGSASMAPARLRGSGGPRRPRSASIRMNSTEYSGLPEARATMPFIVSSVRVLGPASVLTSSRLSPGASRARDSVVARSWGPQAGRRSSSSGRAVATISSATSCDHSTTCSMKSSTPSSAQWMSSKARTSGSRRASASRKCRQAAKAARRSSPWARPSPSRPTSERRWLSIRAACAGAGTRSATAAASLPAAVAAPSVARMSAWRLTISPRAQKVTPSG